MPHPRQPRSPGCTYRRRLIAASDHPRLPLCPAGRRCRAGPASPPVRGTHHRGGTHLYLPARPGENETGEFLTTTRIIELIGHSIRTPLDKRKVGRAMARMGFTGKKTMKANGGNVIVLTGDDIKNRQRLDALNSSNDDSQ
ncbi:MAG: hypothetical protein II269_02030 [Bacteroidaceae bacterium]|nr:hypothetical protein [Bacteroidaceae bacterium]